MGFNKVLMLFVFSFVFSVNVSAKEGKAFSELVVFSGTLNDTGNYESFVGGLPPIFWEGRLSNGPLIVDYFSEALGLSVEPSLHLEGPAQGNNYSMTDAWAGRYTEQDLSGMLDAYFAKTNGVANEDALYFLWIGGHDVIEAISAPGPIQYSMIDEAVIGIETALHRLIEAGAKHIFSPTYTDIGFAPGFARVGLSDRAAKVSGYYNKKFRRMLSRVEWQTGQRIYRFDYDKYVDNLLENHQLYGFENITEPCIELLQSGGCNPDTFLFYTDVLVSSQAHKVMADAFVQDLLHQVTTCKQGNWHPRPKRFFCNRKYHHYYR